MYFNKISVLVLFVAVVIGAKESVGATSRSSSSSSIKSDQIFSSSGVEKSSSHPTFTTAASKSIFTKGINKTYQKRHHVISVRGGGGGGSGNDDDGKASMLSSVFNLGM